MIRQALPTYSFFQINGERNPSDVYKDFRSAVLRILGSVEAPLPLSSDHQTKMGNGVAPSGANMSNVPPVPYMNGRLNNYNGPTGLSNIETEDFEPYKPPGKGFPPVVWVIGMFLSSTTKRAFLSIFYFHIYHLTH